MKQSHSLTRIVGATLAKKLPTCIADIVKMSSDDFRQRGIGAKDAEKIAGAIALAKEIAEPPEGYSERMRITCPSQGLSYCLTQFTELRLHGVQEEFWIVTLDTKNHPINKHMITTGTLRNSLVHPREVFRPAIADAACSILAVHNHPSGDPTPSDQDISVTERLESAAEIIGIPLIDHIVVAGEKAISIHEWRSGNRW